MLKMANGATCLVEVSYASKLEEELCPQTLVHLEGAHGSATLRPHYALTVVKDSQVTHQTATPRSFPWMTSPWEVIQDSVIAIEQHWVDCLRENRPPETLGRDSLRTLELVFGAYQSVETGTIYKVSDRV
jgi:predicted dehydrogenase